MATKAALGKLYNVTGRVSVDVGIEISATSWEDAATKALQLKVQDFITIDGDYIDGRDVEITTIWKE